MPGYGKTFRTFNEVNRNIFIAIEITNNSPEVQDLEFLGLYHRHRHNTALQLRSIVGEKLSDDWELRDIIDLQCFRALRHQAVVFNTSMLYDMFKDKIFTHKHVSHRGSQSYMPFDLQDYYRQHPYGQTVEVYSIAEISAGTSFHQSHIQPGERLVIFFVPTNHQRHDYLQALIDKANRIFTRDKKRKILLTL